MAEEYDAELERMNVAMSTENQGLQYDNKQLNSLLKEYEQTLDSVMTTFRKRAVSLAFLFMEAMLTQSVARCTRTRAQLNQTIRVFDYGFRVTFLGSSTDFRDRKSTRLNSSHSGESRMPSSA